MMPYCLRASLVLSIFFAIYAKHSYALPTLLKTKSETVPTAYLNLMITEYKFGKDQRGHGGAIAIVDGNIILGRSENTFAKINPQTWEYKDNFLPALETGEKFLKDSKRYQYKELLPRIEDLIYYHNAYYVTYTRYSKAEDLIYFVIAKIKTTDKNWTTVYQSPGLLAPYYTLGVGGRMAVKNNRLYFTVGDFSLDRINGLSSDVAPQNPKLPWGKINYIDMHDGKFHPYTLGHRNPLGLIFLGDGTLLSSENGPQGGDELNIIELNKNYGWPYESYGTTYGSFKRYKDQLPAPPKNLRFNKPIYAFVPSPAISDMIQISGFDPNWNNDILLGSLKANTLFHIRLEEKKVMFVEPIFINYRIRGLKQAENKFYVLTDNGSILELKNSFINSVQ